MILRDPTYVVEKINANPTWKLAFMLSEFDNDKAPVGWSKYINLATYILANYELKERY